MGLKIALVTTPSEQRSGVADYTRQLLPHLREHCDIESFVQEQAAGREVAGVPARSVRELKARDFDRILYQIGNEPSQAFMLPVLRALGGAVAQHDWVLFDLAQAAFPSLVTGGWRGYLRAVREGGIKQARLYRTAHCTAPIQGLAREQGAQQLGEGELVLPLNRAVVRHGDTFLVHSRRMRERILEERNDNTYIAVIPYGREGLDQGEDGVRVSGEDAASESFDEEASWSHVARCYAAFLEDSPAHRTNRKSLIQAAILASDAARIAREEERVAEREGRSS